MPTRPLMGTLLAASLLAAVAAGQPAAKATLPVVSYAELGKMVRADTGKVVVVYFWTDS